MRPDPCIVVIDDNPSDRALSVRTLRQALPQARIDDSVTDLASLEARLARVDYDAVVTDYQLQWTTGLDVLHAARARHPQCAVVMFTNTGSEEIAAEGLKAGLDDYVIKAPRRFNRLGVAVAGALERAQLRIDRERAFAELRHAKEAAERANRLKDEFLANLSHELRTPLNAILGWVHLLRKTASPTDASLHGLAVIERNARQQVALIEDLLDVSRIVSGKVQIDRVAVDLTHLVGTGVEALAQEAASKRVTVTTRIEPDLPPTIGDPTRLLQVLCNLLSNAVKFTPPGGAVQVSLAGRGEDVELAVSDNGTGIATDFLAAVFDPFRQADASTTRRHGGLGLGLAIAKRLVEEHCGRIAAASAGPGRGATFTVLLPAWSGPAGVGAPIVAPAMADPAARPPVADCPAPSIADVRVLVVDDEPDGREAVVQALRHCAVQVRSAGSAAEARLVLGSFDAQVLVSDIGMPDEDGHELMRSIRHREAEDGRGTRIGAIALTAFARPEDRQRALAAGFDSHMAKPVDLEVLLDRVAGLAAATRNVGR